MPEIEMDAVESAARSSDVYVFYTDTGDVVTPFDPDNNGEYRFLGNLEACSDGWRWSDVGRPWPLRGCPGANVRRVSPDVGRLDRARRSSWFDACSAREVD